MISTTCRYLLYKKSKKASKKPTKKRKKDNSLAVELKYLCLKFKLDKERIDTKAINRIASVLDGLIISLSFTLANLFTRNMIFSFLIGFVAIFVLIYGFYEILGIILVKKGYEKNGL